MYCGSAEYIDSIGIYIKLGIMINHKGIIYGMSKKANKLYDILIICAFIIIVGLMICTNLFHYCYEMNADIASEAVLARLIWESGEWLPKSWYTSTEFRIFTTPNLAALFYGMVHDMAVAMGMACITMLLGILASGYFFISQFSFSRTHKLVFLLLCLIIPNHYVILELFYLFAAYYAVHVIVMFLILGIYARWISGKKVHIIWLGTMALLSFAMGMQGVRGILVLNAPLLAIETLRQLYLVYEKTWNRKSLSVILWCVLMLLTGYAGTLLSFSVGQELHRNIRKGPSKLFQVVLPDMQECLGLIDIELEGRILCLIFLLIAIVVLISCVLWLYRKQCGDQRIWIYMMFWGSTAITVVAVAFTTIESSQRYYFMLLFGMAFGFTCFIKHVSEKSSILAGVGYVMVFFLFVFQLRTIYIPIMQSNEPAYSEELEVCKHLEENGYEIAYADFERANAMTVLSGGELRVAAVASVEKMDICKWLNSTEWYVPNVPYESRTAYIATETEREDFAKFYNLHKGEIWFDMQIGKFYIYGSEYNYSHLEDNGE